MAKKKLGLASKVLIGLAIGFVIGIIVHYLPKGTLRDEILINGVFQFVGQVLLRGIMVRQAWVTSRNWEKSAVKQ